MRPSHYREVDELHAAHLARRSDIRRRLDEFAAVPRQEYFPELVYCLLTPQSSAVNAARAVDALRETACWHRPDVSAGILRRPSAYIRFHNTKARRIAEAHAAFDAIADAIAATPDAHDLRAWLAGNVRGFGWKEASHFLRNIGRRNLAILDRHILKNLKHHGVLASVPATLTPTRYAAIERRFGRFAEAVGIPMDELDLLFWSNETGEILK
jgi:N-glycosylase/DNA lyase